jgi:hypothetical protein
VFTAYPLRGHAPYKPRPSPTIVCILYLIRQTLSPCDLLSCRFTETKLTQDTILTSQFHHEILIENMQYIWLKVKGQTSLNHALFQDI